MNSAASLGTIAGTNGGTTAKTRPLAIVVGGDGGEEPASRFNPLAVLLHELNQPLTGLQCSLELATVGSRTPEQYLNALHQGLELVARMRMLVEALREVADTGQNASAPLDTIALDSLLRNTVDDLRPVADSRAILIDVDGKPFPRLCRVQHGVAATLFRVIDSALSLAAANSVLRIHLGALDQQAAVAISWMAESKETGRLALSPPDLGLLVARASWESAGGQWDTEVSPANHSVNLLLPWAESNDPSTSSCGDPS
jgi:phospho-acceptor domain-containing protein